MQRGPVGDVSPEDLTMGHKPMHVLVVDDDPDIRQGLHQRLTPEGFAVTTASTGEEALALCSRQPPDAMILDINLPGADGYEVCERVRRAVDAPALAVIFLTGVGQAGTNCALGQMVTKAGGDYFISKPYDPHLLVRLLDRIAGETK